MNNPGMVWSFCQRRAGWVLLRNVGLTADEIAGPFSAEELKLLLEAKIDGR